MSDVKNARDIVQFYEYLGWNDKATTFLDSVKGIIVCSRFASGILTSSAWTLLISTHHSPTFESGETSNLIQYVSLAYSEKTGVYLSIYFHSSL
jgi:hypothetical protein